MGKATKLIIFLQTYIKYWSFTEIPIGQKCKGSDMRAVKCKEKSHKFLFRMCAAFHIYYIFFN